MFDAWNTVNIVEHNLYCLIPDNKKMRNVIRVKKASYEH